jgi:membrane protease YdiL (CAAX protease family)
MFITIKSQNYALNRGMSNNLKIPSPWSQLALLMGLLGGSLIFFGIIATSIYHYAGILGEIRAGTVWADSRATGVLKWLQALSSILVFGIPGYFYARLTFRDRPLYQLGLRPAGQSNFYLLAILLLLISLPLEGWLGELNKHFPLPQWMIQAEKESDRQVMAFLKVNTPFDILINLLVMAALPAFFEELCFRGALQRILIHVFRNPWAGIIVTGILFSAFHMQFEGFLPRMFLGILLGAVCWYSGSLWASILAHFFFNGIQVMAAMFFPGMVSENPSIPLYTVLISMVIVVGLLYRLRRQSTVTYAGAFGLS